MAESTMQSSRLALLIALATSGIACVGGSQKEPFGDMTGGREPVQTTNEAPSGSWGGLTSTEQGPTAGNGGDHGATAAPGATTGSEQNPGEGAATMPSAGRGDTDTDEVTADGEGEPSE